MRLRLSAALSSVLLGLLLAAAPSGAQAPTGSISGTVVDSATQRPISGVRIAVTNALRDTYTKDDGTFLLARVPTGPQRVRVSIIGYGPSDRVVTVVAGQTATVRFALNHVAVLLPEVVSVGYGTTRRQDITGSVSSVPSEELQRNIVSSVQQGLQGRVAGVSVTQGDAAPGGGIRVQVRGTNSMNPGSAQPLYVIDGVPYASSGLAKSNLGATSEGNLNSLTETNPLATIASADIESIDILKDASATAIYGSRGANGVVIITTKHGQRNRTGQMSLTASTGFSSVVREIPVLDAYGFASYVNQAFINAFGPQTEYPYGGRPGSKTPEQLRQELGGGTNWQREIFRTAPVQDVQLAFTGGDENGSYLVSGNVLNQAGVITGSQFQRGGGRINLDRNINSRLKVSSNLAVTRSVNDMVRSSTINGWRAVGIVRQALMYQPWQWRDTTSVDPRTEDATTWATYGANPLRYTDEVSETDQITNGIGGVRGVVQLPFDGLSLDLNVGANYERRSYGTYYPRTVNEGRAANGLAVQSGSEFGSMVSDNLLRFNREYGTNHRFDAVAGFSLEQRKATWNGVEVQNFPDDILRNNVLGNGTSPQKPYSGLSRSKLASWLGRVNYTAFDRYNFTATVRRDGSSRFAANYKWGTFPAFAFAWQANKEPFLEDVNVLSNLKLRLSYGKSGNQAISEYQSLPAIAGANPGLTLNESEVPTYIVTQLGNPNLRWETTDQYNAGLDVALWQSRLSGSVDVYRKNTYDLLQQITLAGNTGFYNAWINSGNVSNKGIELQLGYDILSGSTASAPSWNLSVNASHNKNKIESLGPVTQQFAGRLGAGGGLETAPFIQKPGLAIGTMWGYRTNGLVRTAEDSAAESALQGKTVRVGDLRYVDTNGDGKLDAKDQTVIGDANADWVFGVNNRFSWGRFDLSALVTAVRGNQIINAERIRWLDLNGSQNVPKEFVENAFDPTTNPNGKYPQVRQDRKYDTRFNDMFVEDGAYVRLKNLQVGYNVTLPRARSARIYVNGLNLLTWTNYMGYDPEVSAFGSPDRPGVDLGSYPQARTITIGINTSF